MTPLAVIRHGPTAWNAEGRIQGTTDIPLSAAGRAVVGGWRVPPELAGFRWVSSPLSRALETARLLGAEPDLEPLLAEMDHGEWEGRVVRQLRAELGPEMAENERRGLDFRPPGGESPRDVQRRLRPWLAGVARAGRPTVAVCHHGVLRAIHALASGWDMTAEPPVGLAPAAAHLYALDDDGRPTVERLNISLTGDRPASGGGR